MEVGMRHSRAIAIGALVVVLGPGSSSADTFRNFPSRPLLVMTTHAQTNVPLLPPALFMSSLVVFANRTLAQSFHSSASPPGVAPQLSLQTRGRIPAAEWAALLSAMTDSRVDVHENCRIPRVGLPVATVTSEIVFRWYGRQGRTNTFSVEHPGDSGPTCDLSVLELVTAANAAAAKVAADGTSEYFSVP
jgi:hypothetical protein